MARLTMWLLGVVVVVCDLASCSVTCPDRSTCPDDTTCCKTANGYSCCPYPKAVCCSDLAHCCPFGYRCNLILQRCEKQNQQWINTPMVKNEVAKKADLPVPPVSPLQPLIRNHEPEQERSDVVRCDYYHTCPDLTTCCKHPTGTWFCCPYAFGRCCLDGLHCCPYGYVCDLTYQHCLKQSLMYPFTPKLTASSFPATLSSSPKDSEEVMETPMTVLTEANGHAPETEVIHCDSQFYCSKGTSCCKGSTGQWGCCPYPLGTCCEDGQHCCEYGYKCHSSSKSCIGFYARVPSGAREPAGEI